MATYKVIQDIEAEDKLLGPLTLRQFIYAGICAISLYFTFLSVTKGFAFLAIVFLPLAGASGFFAWPWSQDQPTEVWALAKIRFMVKPRKRIWDQSGARELVTITAPKKISTVYSNNLTETEVQSRLRALADTIDSRGWAIKNVNVNMFGQPVATTSVDDSDRLVDMASLPQAVPDLNILASEDMLEEGNAVSRQFDDMLAASTKAHRDEILKNLRSVDEVPAAQTQQPQPTQAGQEQQAAADYWFLNQPSNAATAVPRDAVTFNTQVVTPGATRAELPIAPGDPTEDEQAVVERLRQEEARQQTNAYNTHWHIIKPLSDEPQPANGQQAAFAAPAPTFGASQPQPQMQQVWQPQPTQMMPQNAQNQYAPPVVPQAYTPAMAAPTIATQQSSQPQVTQAPDPAILQLASNDDLDVATLARQANRHKEELLQDEVVISLH